MADWSPFRRALRGDERRAFDEVMQAVRERAAAGGMVPSADALEPMLLAILTEAFARIRALEEAE